MQRCKGAGAFWAASRHRRAVPSKSALSENLAIGLQVSVLNEGVRNQRNSAAMGIQGLTANLGSTWVHIASVAALNSSWAALSAFSALLLRRRVYI